MHNLDFWIVHSIYNFLDHLYMDFGVFWLVLHLLLKRNPLRPFVLDLEFICLGNFIDLHDPVTEHAAVFILGFVLRNEPLDADFLVNS